MDDYINRKAVMQEFAAHVRRSNNSDFAPAPTWNDAVQIVEDFPTIDAVPVVRCKDCYACEIADYYGNGKKRVCRLFDRQILENDFCSYGERKERGVNDAAD